MGLNTHSIAVLLDWLRGGAHLGETLTLGKLDLVLGRYESLDDLHLLLERGLDVSPDDARRCRIGDDVLELLGATSVESLDKSDFEGATLLHDLNEPLPSGYHERFDTVLDGGTLEHVFRFPTAIASCMELVRAGGHVILYSPMNNQPGHGFYQFTPELLYRTFSPENGFRVVSMVAIERFTGGWRYAVTDPATLGRRLRLVTGSPVDLLTIALRERVVPVLRVAPDQSDYASLWAAQPEPRPTPAPRPGRGILRWLRERADVFVPGLHHRLQSRIDRARYGTRASFEGQPDSFVRVLRRRR